MRYKPKMRVYRCRNPKCRFVFHRDGVGSINIRRKYLGLRLSSWGHGVPHRSALPRPPPM
jgi:transposase